MATKVYIKRSVWSFNFKPSGGFYIWDPIDGEVDPRGVTYAFRKAAKVHGGKYC